MTACPECGVDEERIGSDAIAALRSFPRRFAAAMRAADGTRDSAVATAETAQTVRELARANERLASALGRPAPPAPADGSLTSLETTVDAIVKVADETPWEAWGRSMDGGPDVRTVLAHAAHVGSHHLHAIRRVVPED